MMTTHVKQFDKDTGHRVIEMGLLIEVSQMQAIQQAGQLDYHYPLTKGNNIRLSTISTFLILPLSNSNHLLYPQV